MGEESRESGDDDRHPDLVLPLLNRCLQGLILNDANS